MTAITDAMIEAAARAIAEQWWDHPQSVKADARAALEAVAPLIAAQALRDHATTRHNTEPPPTEADVEASTAWLEAVARRRGGSALEGWGGRPRELGSPGSGALVGVAELARACVVLQYDDGSFRVVELAPVDVATNLTVEYGSWDPDHLVRSTRVHMTLEAEVSGAGVYHDELLVPRPPRH